MSRPVRDVPGALTSTAPPADRRRLATRAPLGALVLGVVLVGAAIVFARVDLALVALPLLVVAGGASDALRSARAAARVSLPRDRASDTVVLQPGRPGEDLRWTVRVAPGELDAQGDPRGAPQAIHLRVGTHLRAPRDVVVTAAQARELGGALEVLHSGRQTLVRVSRRLLGADVAWTSVPTEALAGEQVVVPGVVPVRDLPLPAHLTGTVGQHPSTRRGSGGEFRDIGAYQPGDRLRRIDWKATARLARRPGDLYVRRTYAESDVTVQLVLDSHDVLGEDVSLWHRRDVAREGTTSMDVAREAAVALASAYSAAGDSVGLLDLAAQARAVRPGGGQRHLDRVVRAVATTEPLVGRFARRRPPQIPAGALVVVLTSGLDDGIVRTAEQWRAAGHRVLVVDTLPPLRVGRLDAVRRDGLRLVLLERDERLRRAQAVGVEVVRWTQRAGTAERAAALRALTRAGARR